MKSLFYQVEIYNGSEGAVTSNRNRGRAEVNRSDTHGCSWHSKYTEVSKPIYQAIRVDL